MGVPEIRFGQSLDSFFVDEGAIPELQVQQTPDAIAAVCAA
jgi:hypothetical protein